MAGLETAGRHGTASWLATDRLEVASNQPGAAISERDGSNLGLGTTAPDYSTHRIEAALAGCGRRVGCAAILAFAFVEFRPLKTAKAVEMSRVTSDSGLTFNPSLS